VADITHLQEVPAPPRYSWVPLNGAHYLHPQKTSRVPRRYVFFDTEAYRHYGTVEETQTWRCGVTACVKWRVDSKTWSPALTVRHGTPEELWAAITGFARVDNRTVVVAHNLGYDLRLSRAFELLPAMGWTVTKLSLSGEHISLDVKKGKYSLVLVDSKTVINHALEVVGRWKGEPKPELPADDAPDDVWWERCETDVRLLAWAYMEVVRWLTDDDLGGWARSGSGIGWHVLLRRHLHEKVLVHGEREVLDLEGQSMYSGRAEAWKIGKYRKGPYTVWDYETAYAHVAQTESLPARHLGVTRGGRLSRMVEKQGIYSYLVHARVDTPLPVLPWRDDHGVCWPVGSFSGWWWQWELAAAEQAGARVKVGEAHRYAASPWLADWANWCLGVMKDQGTPEDKVRASLAKHWTRTVIGRSAMRYKDWQDKGDAWVPGVSYWPLLDYDKGTRGAALQLGGQRWEAWEEHWWDNALPQVLSAVMAHVRVRLWNALQVAGLDNLMHCDTDCLITTPAGSARIRAALDGGLLGGLRPKEQLHDIEPLAPTLVEGSTYRRLAGVPRTARRTGQTTYESERWEGVTSSLSGGTPDVVRIAPLRQHLELADWRRRHNPDGSTSPYTVINDVRQLPQEVAQ
jgi:hypothetical protein